MTGMATVNPLYNTHLERGCIVADSKILPNGIVWATLLNPKYDCCRPLRGGWFCSMEKGHRGRCSSVTFCCDLCGKTRRGSPDYSDESVSACFMCYSLPRKANIW